MSTKNPRIPVTLDSVLYRWILEEAKKQRISISLAVRDAVKFTYEWAATLEVLSSPELMEQILKSRKTSKKDYISFNEAKRRVYNNAG